MHLFGSHWHEAKAAGPCVHRGMCSRQAQSPHTHLQPNSNLAGNGHNIRHQGFGILWSVGIKGKQEENADGQGLVNALGFVVQVIKAEPG